ARALRRRAGHAVVLGRDRRAPAPVDHPLRGGRGPGRADPRLLPVPRDDARGQRDARASARRRAVPHSRLLPSRRQAISPRAGYPQICPYLYYRDADAAIEWLAQAFGLPVRPALRTAEGEGVPAQLALGSR